MKPLEFLTWRRERGFSQANLAGLMGISIRTISRWERGVTPISASGVKFLQYLDTPPPKSALVVAPKPKPEPQPELPWPPTRDEFPNMSDEEFDYMFGPPLPKIKKEP